MIWIKRHSEHHKTLSFYIVMHIFLLGLAQSLEKSMKAVATEPTGRDKHPKFSSSKKRSGFMASFFCCGQGSVNDPVALYTTESRLRIICLARHSLGVSSAGGDESCSAHTCTWSWSGFPFRALNDRFFPIVSKFPCNLFIKHCL